MEIKQLRGQGFKLGFVPILLLLFTRSRSSIPVPRFITDLKFRWTATWRTVTWAAAAWGETTFTWREKQSLSFSRGDGRRSFF